MITRHLSLLLLAISLLLPCAARGDERGDMTLGIGGGNTTVNHSGYSDIYFRYSFASHVRIAPHIGYVFKHENASAFNASIDMQFPFSVARGLQLFPLAGVTFNSWNYSFDGSDSHLGLNVGGGIDLKFTPSLRLTISAAYSFMKHTDGLYVGAGIGYNF